MTFLLWLLELHNHVNLESDFKKWNNLFDIQHDASKDCMADEARRDYEVMNETKYCQFLNLVISTEEICTEQCP